MNFVYEIRASTILHNLLRASSQHRPWLLPANVCPIVPLTFLKAGCEFEFVVDIVAFYTEVGVGCEADAEVEIARGAEAGAGLAAAGQAKSLALANAGGDFDLVFPGL